MVEITLKIIGASMPILASLVYGRVKIRELRRNISELSACIRLVRYVGDNVEHFMKPIPEIIDGYTDPILEDAGFLKKARECGLSSAWQNGSFHLSGEALRILDGYFESVGKGYLDDETRLADYTVKRLESILDMEKASSVDKERIYKTVPPMLAGSVVLILI